MRKRGTRTSLTFRKVLRGPCDCNFPKYCDSKIVTNSPHEADVEAMALTEIASLEVNTVQHLVGCVNSPLRLEGAVGHGITQHSLHLIL